ncbi:M48 family metallopeptidase [Pseudothauera rhizosphaerae]|uniref:M48 family metallopeptidase n=1 Tax=Pseudothauera rhizosphaerae TaxID=2565932 RepID=UPI001454B90B|nr:M48 family metallopeptidase [Pseudothauera rhizosphaerae]
MYARLAARLTLAAGAGFLLFMLTCAGGLAAAAWGFYQGWEAGAPQTRAAWWLGALAALFGVRHVLGLSLLPVPGPRGIPLSHEAAGALRYRIDEVGRRLSVPPLDGVWITDEMNAAVLQRFSRGRIETHMMIGLPLAHCLSRRQFLAVLAHEFGHLVTQRQGFGARGACLRAWWLRVAEGVATRHPALAPWLDRRFRRYTLGMLRLSRLEEFEADAVAARLVGRRLLGEALIEVSEKDRFLREDYWPKVLAQCESAPEPCIRPYRDMGLGVAAGFHAHSVLHAGFCGSEAEDAGALHPTPADRLRALRVPTGEAVPPERSAAVHYLSALLPQLSWAFDRHWWNFAGRSWRRAYRQARHALAADDEPK